MNPPILIADDDDAIIEVMTIILEGGGHKVVIAKTADDVFTLIEDTLPRLLFLDIALGGSDGREVTKRLKLRADMKRVPIIISSANSETAQIAQEIGADGFLSKPFEIDELLAIVQKYTVTDVQ